MFAQETPEGGYTNNVISGINHTCVLCYLTVAAPSISRPVMLITFLNNSPGGIIRSKCE